MFPFSLKVKLLSIFEKEEPLFLLMWCVWQRSLALELLFIEGIPISFLCSMGMSDELMMEP